MLWSLDDFGDALDNLWDEMIFVSSRLAIVSLKLPIAISEERLTHAFCSACTDFTDCTSHFPDPTSIVMLNLVQGCPDVKFAAS